MGVGFGFSGATVLVKVDGDPASAAPILRRTVEELAPGAVVGRGRPLTDKRFESASEPRFTTLVLGAFAVLAVALAATGVYGVLLYAVTQRRRELGVRGALRARRSDLLALILREGMPFMVVLATAGVATAPPTRGMTSMLFGSGAARWLSPSPRCCCW